LAHFLAAPVYSAQYIPDSSISPNIPRKSEMTPTGETNAVCIGNTPGVAPAITLCSTIDVTGKIVLFKLPEYTIANLPSSHPLSIVTDSADGTCTTGGGATRVLCAWNGSAWAAIGGTGGTGDITDVLQTSNEICVTNQAGPQPQVSLCPTVIATGKTVQLGRLDLASIITPAQLTTTTNDWNPTGLATASTIRFSTNASQNITGLQGGATGRILTLLNGGSFPAVLVNESVSSTAAYRFSLGSDLALGPSQAIMLQYDNTSARWRALGGVGGGSNSNYCPSATGNDSYACSLSPGISAYAVGTHYYFKADVANTGAATLALNSLSTTPITKVTGGADTPLVTNDIRAGQIVDVVYDGASMQMQSTSGNSPTGLSGLTTGTIPQAASSTTLSNSSVAEDVSYVTSAKPMVAGDCSTNCARFQATGITGNTVLEARDIRTKTFSLTLISPTTGDTNKIQIEWPYAVTLTAMACSTDTGTVSIQWDKRTRTTPNTAGTNALTSTLVCDNDRQATTSFSSAGVSTTQVLSLQITATASSPTVVRIHGTATVD